MVVFVPVVRRDTLIEAAIIGGGPAGAAAAITLCRAGHRPMLIERASGPVHKVCGDFLSAETIQRVLALGCDPAGLGAVPIDRVRLIHGNREAEAALPFPALSLSRRVLDQALLAQAERAGARLLIGQTVRHLTLGRDGWTIQAETRHCAGAVFLGTGKHDLRDHPRPRAVQGAIGLKMYFTLAADARLRLGGATELTLFAGGYAGLQPVEDGQAALCIAVNRVAFQSLGGTWDRLLASIGRASPRFAHTLRGAQALLPRPLAVAGVPYGFLHRENTEHGENMGHGQSTGHSGNMGQMYRMGDQAAVIPSLTGDGMAIALYSGQAAAEAWADGDGAEAYQHRLAGRLAPQMRLARLLHRACMSGTIQPLAIRAAGLCPALLRLAAVRTRLRA